MTDAEVLEAIADVARTHLGWSGALRPEMRLVEELRLDSLRRLTLAVEVEDRFRIRLEPEEEGKIVTLADLIAAVRAKLKEEPSGS